MIAHYVTIGLLPSCDYLSDLSKHCHPGFQSWNRWTEWQDGMPMVCESVFFFGCDLFPLFPFIPPPNVKYHIYIYVYLIYQINHLVTTSIISCIHINIYIYNVYIYICINRLSLFFSLHPCIGPKDAGPLGPPSSPPKTWQAKRRHQGLDIWHHVSL